MTKRNRNLRTCTVMVQTDGTTSIYAVMCGPMTRGGRSFNSHKAEIVGRYEVKGGTPDYRAMTALHVTPQAPAVSWQA